MTERPVSIAFFALIVAGCTGRLGPDPDPAADSGGGGRDMDVATLDQGVVGPGPDASAPGDSGTTLPPADARVDMTVVPATEAERVCIRWNTDRADRSEGAAWTGSAATCSAGDMDDDARERAIKVTNLLRFVAGLPDDIDHDPVLNARCQEAAMMMDANRSLSHTPPTTWNCYTADGALAAGKSNLSGGGSGSRAVNSVDRYMLDRGANNATTLGHRRWILSESNGPWGFGSTNAYSCMYVIHGQTGPSPARPFTAWPPAGIVPIEVWGLGGEADTLDDTGWSIQSETINVSSATATVTRDGEVVPTTSASLLPNYGSRYALKITPQGWRAEAGRRYHVSLSGVSPAVEYDIDVVDCGDFGP